MAPAPVVLWFRHDLRLADNPALAACDGRPVVPLFILDEAGEGAFPPGGAARWWLHHALAALDRSLRARGGRLVLRRGRTLEVLRAVVAESGASAIFWNRRYEPATVARDRAVKQALREDGLEVRSFNGALLFEPWRIRSRAGEAFRVFTPFARACLAAPPPPRPFPLPERLAFVGGVPSEPLEALELLPTGPDWAAGLRATWRPGEDAAKARLAAFLDQAAAHYHERRDRPDLAATSRLSPHLHFGEIGPRTVFWALAHAEAAAGGGPGFATFRRELLWREFAHHLLFHFPTLPEAPLDPAYASFPWRDDPAALRAWQRGRTGYPIVDAGMRELRQTGWMHNRVRMIAGSFLVKDLLLSWQAGAAWFWDNLVDADLANNTLGWQWVAGCGPDAAPFFRIFNPVLQGRRFDPDGAYVRRFVPELRRLDPAHLHSPWQAPEEVLRRAGIVLGRHYPAPIVDHDHARARALAALRAIKGARGAAPRARGAAAGTAAAG